ncbi:MAG: IS3 family transposase [Nocardioidaceae bacterium]
MQDGVGPRARASGLGIGGNTHKKRRTKPAPAPHEDLVKRRFAADEPNRLWCTDITEHPTGTGKVYCCAVLDVFSRVIMGWSIADHMRSELVVDALQMATWRRRPEPGVIVHADRGSQYTSWVFGHRLRSAGLLGSMGRVASSVDNTMMESFWSTMQRELLDTQRWSTQEELASAIYEWIEAWYNPRRRPGTTRAVGTPRSRCWHRTSTRPFTPPPTPRHDHHTNRVRRTGSGSRGIGFHRIAPWWWRTPVACVTIPETSRGRHVAA